MVGPLTLVRQVQLRAFPHVLLVPALSYELFEGLAALLLQLHADRQRTAKGAEGDRAQPLQGRELTLSPFLQSLFPAKLQEKLAQMFC